jgi:hypothetical protein
MNSEYIWSKTGNDPEVERLESLLGEFRFDENTGAHTPARMLFRDKQFKPTLVLWTLSRSNGCGVGTDVYMVYKASGRRCC